MKNIKLTIEYDGTNYSGWQKQPHKKTVQLAIEEAVKKITGETIALLGSGRTDSGVHALGQVANFKTNTNLDTGKLHKALNSILPDDIAVIEVEEASENFHSQYDSKSKIYQYRILNRSYPSAHLRKKVWLINQKLDIEQMRKASDFLLGTHDFKVFSHQNLTVKTTVRNVLNSHLSKNGDLIEFEIEADGFLKRMVRMIVGTIVNVGKGKLGPEEFAYILESQKKNKFVGSAPPYGLFLKEVKY